MGFEAVEIDVFQDNLKDKVVSRICSTLAKAGKTSTIRRNLYSLYFQKRIIVGKLHFAVLPPKYDTKILRGALNDFFQKQSCPKCIVVMPWLGRHFPIEGEFKSRL